MVRKRETETFSRYETAGYLKSEEDMVAYLETCMEEAGDDPAFIAAALGNIARARGMMQFAPLVQRPRAHLARYHEAFDLASTLRVAITPAVIGRGAAIQPEGTAGHLLLPRRT